MGAEHFSPDYTTARRRFRAAATQAGYELEALALGVVGQDGEELTIDVARRGPDNPTKAVVVSSGLHGVEGFMGSAISLALLETCRDEAGRGLILMIHALNPYGFAFIRRVNEDNVDLNRNFLIDGEAYDGCPSKYADLDSLLNPKGPPSWRQDLFLPKALFQIARHGMPALKESVAGGQYEFGEGLFYGGSRPSKTYELLALHLPRWLGPRIERVVHVDFHTGLGKPATYKLLIDRAAGSPEAIALADRFGGDVVEPWAKEGVSYSIRGGMGTWCQHRFGSEVYDVLTAEFGTVSALKVIAALRLENQAHRFAPPGSRAYNRAKRGMMAAFCPNEPAWRQKVVAKGVDIVTRASLL